MLMTKDEIIRHFGNNADCLNISKVAKAFAFRSALWFSKYLFVTDRGDRQKAHCSRCEKNVVIQETKAHQAECICPNCGEAAVVYHTWRKSFNPVDRAYFHFFAKSQDDPLAIVCQGILVSISYEDVFKPIKTYQVLNLYAFAPGTAGQIRIPWYSSRPIHDGIVTKSIYLDKRNINYVNGWFTTSNDSLQLAVVDTPFQYAQCDVHYNYHFDRQGYHLSSSYTFDGYVTWLSNFAKYPAMEYLVKLGFINVLENHIYRRCKTYRAFNLNGKNIQSVLGFKPNKKDIQKLQLYKFTLAKFFLCLKIMKQGQVGNCKLIEIDNMTSYEAERLLEVAAIVPLVKVLEYINKHEDKETIFLYDWVDYIKDCKKLGYDLTNPYYLYPKDLKKAHEQTMKLVKYQKNKILDEKIIKQATKIEKVLEYEDKNYIIRPAFNSKELIDEGSILNHCVASYSQRYASGDTNILFIRQKNNINAPFYTAEIVKKAQSWHILQVRGKGNCLPRPELLSFLQKYETAKQITHEKGVYANGY